MMEENTTLKPARINYTGPIPLSKARAQVDEFRRKLLAGTLDASDLTYGVVHREKDILNYVNTIYGQLKQAQESRNGIPIEENHEWGIAHFFMLDDWGKIVFCVAPVLMEIKPSMDSSMTDHMDPKEVKVWDPFDPRCPYKYTYGYNGEPGVSADDNLQIYDMGQMWP